MSYIQTPKNLGPSGQGFILPQQPNSAGSPPGLSNITTYNLNSAPSYGVMGYPTTGLPNYAIYSGTPIGAINPNVQIDSILMAKSLVSCLPQYNMPLTIFVGNISELVADNLVLQVLQKCGDVNSWKRVRGDAGKLQGFGFCEYSTSEGAFRAMSVLGKIQLADKVLKVSANNINKITLEEYEKARKENRLMILKSNGKTEDDWKKMEEEELLKLKEIIDVLISEYISASKESGALILRQNLLASENEEELLNKDNSVELETDENGNPIEKVSDGVFERDYIQKKKKEMEQIFKDKLRKLEKREKERIKEVERIRERDQERDDNMLRRVEKEWTLMIGFDDDKDSKTYSSLQMEKKKKDRQRELELDEKDKASEEKVIEEKQKKLQEIEEVERKKKLELKAKEEEMNLIKDEMDLLKNPNVPIKQPILKSKIKSGNHDKFGFFSTTLTVNPDSSETQKLVVSSIISAPPLVNSTTPKASMISSDSLFDPENEEEQPVFDKVKPVTPACGVVFNEKELLKNGLTTEQIISEKKRIAKSIINKIPTEQDELFETPLENITESLIKGRLLLWVNKRIVEYIGEEAPSFAEFICEKVANKVHPKTILSDVEQVLDEDASVFMVKLWRLLVYENEAVKFGLN